MGSSRAPNGAWSMRVALLSLFAGLIGVAHGWAAPPPEPRYRLVLQAPPATPVDSVAVSPDGSLVAALVAEQKSPGHPAASFWRRPQRQPSRVAGARFVRDGVC